MLSSTAVINSVVGDELGHLTLTGPNFSATVLDFSHQHRWEELIDVPTTIQDYGIADAYISNGTIYLGGNSITPMRSNGYGYGATYGDCFLLSWGATTPYRLGINFGCDQTDGAYIEFYTRNGQLTGTKIENSQITSDAFVVPNGTSSQFLKADGSVDSNTYITANGSCYSATYATYATYDSQGRTIASEYWVEENFIQSLSLEGLTDVEISNPSSGQVLMYSSGGSWQNTSLTLDDVSDGLTRKLSNYMLSSTAVINSVTGDELGHLTLTGPNFSATVLDFSHQHRWEELIDVPTNLRDLGIKEEYLLLSGGNMSGQIYFGAELGVVFDVDSYIRTGSDDYLHINGYDAIIMSINGTEKVSISSTAITAPSFVKSGGTSSQFLKADGSIDSNTYATQSWVGLNFLALDGGGMITNSNDYGLSVAENGLRFYHNGSVAASLLVSNTPDGPVLDISSGTTIGGYTIWNSGNLNPSDYMLSSTAVINSVVGDELDHLTLTGPNFSATVLDFSHQHRWEELIDVPTTLRDLGITEEYLLLSGGNMSGQIYFGAELGVVFDVDSYIRTGSDDYLHINGYDAIIMSINGTEKVSISSTAITAPSFVKSGGTSSQFLKADGTVDSNTYATQSTVNGLSYINGVALNGDGSLSLTGHSFTTTVLDMTHQHRWEELTDRPLIDMWNDTMVSVNGIVSSGRIGAGIASTPSYMMEVNGQTMLYYEVGIGTAPTSGISLDIDGTARASSFVNNSDIRKKDVIEYDVDPGFEMIANAPTIRFTWKDRGMIDNRVECVGSIAQYWQLALPEAVMTDSEGYLSMQYDVIALIAAVSVAKRVASHEQRIEALERENALLRMDIKALKGEA